MELGEPEWGDDFSGYETMLPSMTTNPNNLPNPTVGGSIEKPKKYSEIYWCKNYQTDNCSIPPPHMAQIKPDEPPVAVLHICANCWSNFKKQKEHPESSCVAKK